jgi:hypothetical protein
VTTKHRCPVITVGNNGTQEKISARWVLTSDGHGRCARYINGTGLCGLDGRVCPYLGRRQFDNEFRRVNLFVMGEDN